MYEGDNVLIEKGIHSVWDFPGYWLVFECRLCGKQEARDTHGRTYQQIVEALYRAKDHHERGGTWARYLFIP